MRTVACPRSTPPARSPGSPGNYSLPHRLAGTGFLAPAGRGDLARGRQLLGLRRPEPPARRNSIDERAARRQPRLLNSRGESSCLGNRTHPPPRGAPHERLPPLLPSATAPWSIRRSLPAAPAEAIVASRELGACCCAGGSEWNSYLLFHGDRHALAERGGRNPTHRNRQNSDGLARELGLEQLTLELISRE